jgi:hypothetical protein
MSRPTPLWRRMQDAAANAEYGAYSDMGQAGYAAMIREMRDRIPESFYGAGGVKAWLSEEANRAEQSE